MWGGVTRGYLSHFYFGGALIFYHPYTLITSLDSPGRYGLGSSLLALHPASQLFVLLMSATLPSQIAHTLLRNRFFCVPIIAMPSERY